MNKPLPPETLLVDLQPTRFIKVENLRAWDVDSITVQIAEVRKETVEPKPGHKEEHPVLYFYTKTGTLYPQGFLLAANVNIMAIVSSTGAKTIGEAIGKKIKIEIGQHKNKDVLRINPEPIEEKSE